MGDSSDGPKSRDLRQLTSNQPGPPCQTSLLRLSLENSTIALRHGQLVGQRKLPYQHDIFVSYRRQIAWTPWTRDHLKRFLESYLQQELGIPPDIFVDERIIVAADWVNALASHLAQSRIVVAVLSRDYFQSRWCLHELDLILDRNGGRPGLFIPLVVHDCENLPDPIARAQPVDFKDFRITDMNRAGQTYEDFSTAVKRLAPMIAEAYASRRRSKRIGRRDRMRASTRSLLRLKLAPTLRPHTSFHLQQPCRQCLV